MKGKKILSWGILIFGSLTTLAGAGFVVMYILEAFAKRLGESDQSLLFWYLPLLFFGVIGLIIGLGLSVWGYQRLKK